MSLGPVVSAFKSAMWWGMSPIPETLTASARSGYTAAMADPLRKMPADEEPDPFRYGSRWKRVRLTDGEVISQETPLTPDDLLDPQPGDEIPELERFKKSGG